jgi:hypothetical protein
VFAPASPITHWVLEIVEEALGLWQQERRREAALLLQDAQITARKDSHCQAVLDRLRSGIPEDLWERAEKALSDRKLATYTTALGLALMGIGFGLFFQAPLLLGTFLAAGLGLGLVGFFGFKR